MRGPAHVLPPSPLHPFRPERRQRVIKRLIFHRRIRRMTPAEAASTLALIVRTGVSVHDDTYRELIGRAGVPTTERLKDDREVGTIRTSIDWIDGVPTFMKEQR